jgi:hypothetical protein
LPLFVVVVASALKLVERPHAHRRESGAIRIISIAQSQTLYPQAVRGFLRGCFQSSELATQPFPNSTCKAGEDNRRKELTANRCPLQLVKPHAADSYNPNGETDE